LADGGDACQHEGDEQWRRQLHLDPQNSAPPEAKFLEKILIHSADTRRRTCSRNNQHALVDLKVQLNSRTARDTEKKLVSSSVFVVVHSFCAWREFVLDNPYAPLLREPD
jgi:hypothetical protein